MEADEADFHTAKTPTINIIKHVLPSTPCQLSNLLRGVLLPI